MPRPRRNRDPEAIDRIAAANIDHQALAEAHQALDINNQRLAELQDRYGPSLVYSYDLYVARGRDLVLATGVNMVELGLILIGIKEREEHGQFYAALDKIGIAHRFARKCMQAAAKFGPDAQRRQLAAHVGSAKMLELLTEDDDELAELAEGGTLAGMTLDEVDKMTARELRDALRKERQKRADERTKFDRLADDKNRTIDDLKWRLADRESQPEAERIKQRLLDIDRLVLDHMTAANELYEAIDAAHRDYQDRNAVMPDDEHERLAQAAAHAVTVLQRFSAITEI